MSFADKFNTSTKKFKFEIPSEFIYADLKQIVAHYGLDAIHKVNAIYINEGNYGEQPVIITDTAKVNAPKHLTQVAKQIINDLEAVQAINEGKAGFKVYQYENNKGHQLSITWVNLQ